MATQFSLPPSSESLRPLQRRLGQQQGGGIPWGRPPNRSINPNLFRPSGFRNPAADRGAGRPTSPPKRSAPTQPTTTPSPSAAPKESPVHRQGLAQRPKKAQRSVKAQRSAQRKPSAAPKPSAASKESPAQRPPLPFGIKEGDPRSSFPDGRDKPRVALKMVPGTGVEPAQGCPHKILSLARLPISPPGHTLFG
jgi:hypothetical protein